MIDVDRDTAVAYDERPLAAGDSTVAFVMAAVDQASADNEPWRNPRSSSATGASLRDLALWWRPQPMSSSARPCSGAVGRSRQKPLV
jgi:hypothetical protein